ncbi:MAG TPA: IS1595 family transposase [Terriglobales bacterium]|nr:IS1595 family transposase [Terriglobales bacterium]
MNLLDVTKNLQTDEQCLDFLERVRWLDGKVRCLQCGGDRISRVERKSKSKNKRTRLFTCLEPTCKHQFSPTAGTLFHDSHLPLHKWFAAVALIVHAKKGMSAKQMERHLAVSYRTAWYMGHRIRKAMAGGGLTVTPMDVRPKLSGIVELDETYVGGKQKGKGVYYGKKQKAVVIGLRERGGDVRLVHTRDAKAKSVQDVIASHVGPEVQSVMTDEFPIYPVILRNLGQIEKHQAVEHKRGSYVRGIAHTNSIESAFSLFKRAIVGSFHKVSHKHLHRYLSEFEYRFNGRKEPDLFGQTVARMVGTGNLEYKELIAE